MEEIATKRSGSNASRNVVRPNQQQLTISYQILLNYPEMVLRPTYPHAAWTEISDKTKVAGLERSDGQWYRTWYDKKKVIDTIINQITLQPELEGQLKKEDKMAYNLVRQVQASDNTKHKNAQKFTSQPVLQRRPLKKTNSTAKSQLSNSSTAMKKSSKLNILVDKLNSKNKKGLSDCTHLDNINIIEAKQRKVVKAIHAEKENLQPASFNIEQNSCESVEVSAVKVDTSGVKEYRYIEACGSEFLLDDDDDDLPVLLEVLKEKKKGQSTETTAGDEFPEGVKHVLVTAENFSLDDGDDSPFIFTFLDNTQSPASSSTIGDATAKINPTKSSNNEESDEGDSDYDLEDEESKIILRELLIEQRNHNKKMEQISILGFYLMNETVDKNMVKGFEKADRDLEDDNLDMSWE